VVSASTESRSSSADQTSIPQEPTSAATPANAGSSPSSTASTTAGAAAATPASGSSAQAPPRLATRVAGLGRTDGIAAPSRTLVGGAPTVFGLSLDPVLLTASFTAYLEDDAASLSVTERGFVYSATDTDPFLGAPGVLSVLDESGAPPTSPGVFYADVM